MKQIKLEENIIYNGSQIEPMWAFKNYGIKDSNIVAWIGPMEIIPDHLIDFEDVGLDIKGDKLAHFMIEHFDIQPADIRLCYHRQRIFVMIIKDLLQDMGVTTIRSGDDLYFSQDNKKNGKLSVSIATCSISSMKIHFALNLTAKGTPDDINTAGVMETGVDIKIGDVHNLINSAAREYIHEISSIELDISKTKVF